MNQTIIEKVHIDSFTFEHIKQDGSFSKRLEFNYQSEKFLNTYSVFIERGFYYNPVVRIESINGDFNFEAKPDYLDFDYEGCTVRFHFGESSCVTIKFYFDHPIEGSWFVVILEEY